MAKYFDPREELRIHEQHLPHWRQAGATYFVTSRLADSMPQRKLREWREHRQAWLAARGLADVAQLDSLPEAERHAFHAVFTAKWHDWLDQGLGECLFCRPEARECMVRRLRSLDGSACVLDAWVVMPNHFHALVAPTDNSLGEIVRHWKGGSASDINKRCGRSGTLWQAEPYDHIVRSEAQMRHYRRYIAENPIKAKLAEGDYGCGLGEVVWDSAEALREHVERIERESLGFSPRLCMIRAEARTTLISSCKLTGPRGSLP